MGTFGAILEFVEESKGDKVNDEAEYEEQQKDESANAIAATDAAETNEYEKK